MVKMRSEELNRLQTTIRELPTGSTTIERCHDEAPDYQSVESLPVNTEDKPLLKRFDEKLTKHKKQRNHYTLLTTALSFCRYRAPPTPNADEDSAHGISLAGLLQQPSAAERFRDWIMTLQNKEGERISPKTESHYRNTIRQFGDLMGDNGRPTHIENIASASGRESNYDPSPKRSNILYWDESVVPILESPRVHVRDKALVAVAWETGARPSELYAMRANHLTDHEGYLIFEIEDSKTYNRAPHVHVSMPYLRKWLLKLDAMTDDVDLPTSPLSLSPEQPIWTKQKDPEQLASRTFGAIGRKIGERLGYHRPTNLKQFRKSRASIIASTGENSERALRHRFGWKPSSSAPAHYIARFSDKANQQIADIDGAPIEITEEYVEPSPFQCSSCGRWSPRHLDTCFWCESEMTGEEQTGESGLNRLSNKAEVNQSAKSTLRERFSDFEVDAQSMELALDLVEAMESNPELTKESVAFVLMTEYDGLGIERVMELLEDGDDDDLRSILEGR